MGVDGASGRFRRVIPFGTVARRDLHDPEAGAAVALALPRPVVVLTSDTKDMERLTDEPGCPRLERVAIVRV